MKTMTHEAFKAALRAQQVAREDMALVCPRCRCLQSARDLIAAGAGNSFEEVEKFLGFSCVGRFTDAGSPRKAPDGSPCNWTLGGLFKLHELEVITDDGKRHPCFEPASAEQAQAHAAKALAA